MARDKLTGVDSMTEHLYTQSQVLGILQNLVNGIELCAKGDIMPKRYKQQMTVAGEDCWVTGATLKDLLEAYLELCIEKGTVMPGILKFAKPASKSPLFGIYLKEFNKTYKEKQQSLTKQSREHMVNKHILPMWGNKKIDEITTTEIQRWLNRLEEQGYSHETLLKIKNNMSPALDSAVEDGYITKNPFKSSRIVIGGKDTEHHKAIPHEKMDQIRAAIPQMEPGRVKNMLVLLSYTGMRFEEVLGLKWDDIDPEAGWILIQRAVVHPNRNQPEEKPPKSKTSERKIPLPPVVWEQLGPKESKGHILKGRAGGAMTYTEARNDFRRIREMFGLGDYSAHDFRDTCATEWREAGVPVDVISHLLGHSKSDITENRYVKYRDELYEGVQAVMGDPQPDKIQDKKSSMRSSEKAS